jgi:hypothetical protein
VTGTRPRLAALRAPLAMAARECYEQWRTFGVLALVLVSIAAGFFSAKVGAYRVAQRIEAHRAEQDRLDLLRRRPLSQSVGWQVEPALRQLRPPAPMSAIVSGLENESPVAWDFGPAGVRPVLAAAAQADVASLGERIDAEFVIRVLLGLFAIVIGLQSVADDRASGILLALFTQPVTPGRVMAGKLTGGIVSVLVALTAVLCTAAAGAAPLIAPAAVARLGLLGLGAALYLITCVGFGMLMAAAFTAYRTAMVSAILIWTLAIVTLPTAGLVAKAFVVEQPAAVLDARLDALVQARTLEAELDMGDALAARFGADQDWVRFGRDPELMAAAVATAEPIWRKHVDTTRRLLEEELSEVRSQAARRRRFVEAVSFLSPAAQLTLLASTVAGVGDPQARAWDDAAALLQTRLDAAVFDDRPRLVTFIPNASAHGRSAAGRTILALPRRPAPAIETLPGLAAPDLSVRGDAVRARGQYACLLVYAGAVTGGCVLAFRRLFRAAVA